MKLLKAIFLLVPLLLWAGRAEYEVYYGWLSAGKIEVDFSPQKAVVRGKSGGLVGLFYRYRLYLVYDFSNETASFMEEQEGQKRKYYDYGKILQKKAWLPIVLKLLRETEVPEVLEVGNYRIVLQKEEKDSFVYLVEGSKKVKKVTLKGWRPGYFPREIEIQTDRGSLTLKLKR
ncbi:MAG: DUF3108 domain-containing protein [Aquificae bacterium]|nr:DUF3108 domain-containing protein [Aquificota bacterium]